MVQRAPKFPCEGQMLKVNWNLEAWVTPADKALAPANSTRKSGASLLSTHFLINACHFRTINYKKLKMFHPPVSSMSRTSPPVLYLWLQSTYDFLLGGQMYFPGGYPHFKHVWSTLLVSGCKPLYWPQNNRTDWRPWTVGLQSNLT